MNALVQSSRKKHAEVAASVTPDSHQYLTFLSGSEVFAIGILSIKEIIEYGGLTVVPMMPNFVRGVINLRGAVVPVIDLLARFGKAKSDITKRTCIVIVEIEADGEQQVIGIMVDAVHAVVDIAATEIAPAPAFGARIRPEFIEGMGKINDRFIILINVNKVLSVDEIGEITGASGHPAAHALPDKIESAA